MRGGWAQCVVHVNETLDDLTAHTDEIARVVTAVAQGDLTQTVEIGGADGYAVSENGLKRYRFRDKRDVDAVMADLAGGAQKWVGRARWHYGSFYLWGDVPALMPIS